MERYAQGFAVRLQKGHGNGGRLFHDIPEVSGDGQLITRMMTLSSFTFTLLYWPMGW
jgi:hypothetical protein